MMFWSLTLCDKQRKMLTQEFRTFIHNMEKEFGGDEDNDPVIVERIQRTLRIIFETLVRNGLEDRYTSDRALRHLRSDLRVSLEQEDLLPYGLMFFSSGGVLHEDLEIILHEYGLCVANPVDYVAPDDDED